MKQTDTRSERNEVNRLAARGSSEEAAVPALGLAPSATTLHAPAAVVSG